MLNSLESPLYRDFRDTDIYFLIALLLSNYINSFCFEKIVKNNEVLLSNPLLMNDLEEIRFGINNRTRLFVENKDI